MRKEKQFLLDEMQDHIRAATAFVVVNYEKLEPNNSWELRSELAKNGSLLEIVKKRVFLKAAKNCGVEIDESSFGGHIAVAFVRQADALPACKAILKYADDKRTVKFACGHMEGKFVPAADVEQLAKLPGINEMRATLLALFVSPMSQTLSVIESYIADQEPNN